MLDNLALDLTNSFVKSNMLNSTDTQTNASYASLNYLFNGGGTTSDQYATVAVSNWTSSFSYSNPKVNMTNKDTVPSNSTLGSGSRKIGGYYNFCAASAGSYCYGSGSSVEPSYGNATEDICPKGWRLPTGGTNGEFDTLYNNSSYNNYTNFRTALSLPLSGYFYSGEAYNQGGYGYWWSSTRSNTSDMYLLYLDTSTPSSGSRHRYYGYPIRCLASS